MEPNETLSFEEALKRLEHITQALESPDLDLATALKYYEEGMRLAHYCKTRLEEAQLKVETLSRQWNEPDG